MHSIRKTLCSLSGIAILLWLASCTEKPVMDLGKTSLIPWPRSVTADHGSFEITAGTSIIIAEDEGEELISNAEYLAALLRPPTGFAFAVLGEREVDGYRGHIRLILNKEDIELGPEGYELQIDRHSLTLQAGTGEGIFRGIQTLRQLLPAKIESPEVQAGPWHLATGSVRDYPVYHHRGAMLDVSRHFFKPDEVKRLIDLLALYKINRLHLHLSDDQGWRIAIHSWPDLTRIGGSTAVGGGEGGYYTQEEYADIVDHAMSRYITIIPEIDMPGHTNAALAAYAELNCDGKARELYTGTEVGFSTLCARKEITYAFVDSVVRELAAITPGPYIHIGGDESHVTSKEDYIYFIDRVQKIVQDHGKIMIGWEEIAQANLSKGTIAQHWADTKYPLQALDKGVSILMSPASRIYMDMKYDSSTRLGLDWAGYIEVDTAYLWDPAELITCVDQSAITGIEAPLWTETIVTMQDLEFMVFPRLPGYAEIGWTPAAGRNWQEYRERLAQHGERLDNMHVNYYRSPKVPWKNRNE